MLYILYNIIACWAIWYAGLRMSVDWVSEHRNPFFHDSIILSIPMILWPIMLPLFVLFEHHTDPEKCRMCRKKAKKG